MLEDLNARQGWKASGAIVVQYGENTINNDGERLIEFSEQIEFKNQNSKRVVQTKDIHKYTWTKPASVSFKSIIDYIIVKQTTKASSPIC